MDYYNLHVIDCAAMISDLKYLRNKNAELIITSQKGYRHKNNKRNTHSWSIADGAGLIKWIRTMR